MSNVFECSNCKNQNTDKCKKCTGGTTIAFKPINFESKEKINGIKAETLEDFNKTLKELNNKLCAIMEIIRICCKYNDKQKGE